MMMWQTKCPLCLTQPNGFVMNEMTLQQKMAATRLSNIDVLIADHDRAIAIVLRDMLRAMGFKNIRLAHDGREALEQLRNSPPDILVTEWNMPLLDGITLTQSLRYAPNQKLRYLPVVMLTARSAQQEVITARDAGVSEFVVKPFTVRNLVDRVKQLINQTKNYVWSPHYRGPDRRDPNAMPPPGVAERRTDKPPISIRQAYSDFLTDDEVRIVLVEPHLKEKIGADVALEDVFSEANLARAQAVLDESQQMFFALLERDCQSLFSAHKHLASGEPPKLWLETILHSASLIKGRAGTFGFECATQVADSLVSYAQRLIQPSAAQLTVVRKHIEGMATILQKRIMSTQAEECQELLDNLDALTRKFAAS